MGNYTKDIPATLKRFAHMIDEIEDDRGDDNGYFVYLKYGWINGPDEMHMVHEDTLKQCAEKLANVTRCACSECLDNLPEALQDPANTNKLVEKRKAEIAKIVHWATGQNHNSIAARRARALAEYIGTTTEAIEKVIDVLTKLIDDDKPVKPEVVKTAVTVIRSTLLPGVK